MCIVVIGYITSWIVHAPICTYTNYTEFRAHPKAMPILYGLCKSSCLHISFWVHVHSSYWLHYIMNNFFFVKKKKTWKLPSPCLVLGWFTSQIVWAVRRWGTTTFFIITITYSHVSSNHTIKSSLSELCMVCDYFIYKNFQMDTILGYIIY